MIESLDTRTMLLVGALVSLTLAGVMVYYSIARRTYPGFHHWTAGIISAGTGAVLLSWRGHCPDFISMVLGNTLIISMPFLLSRGLAIFLNVKWKLTAVNWLIFTLFFSAFLWSTYVHPSLYARILCFSLVLGLFFCEALVIALRFIPSVLGEQNWLLIASMLFAVLSAIFRILITASNVSTLTFLEKDGILHSIALLMTILSVVGSACSFLILNTHRIENDLKRASQKIENLANMDGLTNLFNRRYFDKKLAEEFSRSQRTSQPLSLIMADLDFFKLYNDTYGHQAGDDCLRIVATILKKAGGRISDIAARYGGEEFVILLPNTDRNGALKVGEAVRESLAAEAIPHKTSTVKDIVTLTMGVATVTPGPSITPKMLVKFADQALYTGKANGKDRIQFFT